MNTPYPSISTAPRRSRLANTLARTFIVASATISVWFLAACDDRAAGNSDADHAAEPHATEPEDHAGHDHGDEHVGHEGEVTLTEDAIARYGIRVEPASLWLLEPTFTAPGRVAFNADAMAHVGSALDGRVVELYATLGSTVSRGDPLLVVESPALGEAQSDFLAKQSAVAAMAPAVEIAKSSWERARELLEKSQGISLHDVQMREADYLTREAELRAAQAAAVAAENRLHLLGMSQEAVAALAESTEVNPRHTLHAPIGGQVVAREVTLGEIVSPDRESLLVLADLAQPWVFADVPEARLGEVAPGAKAWVALGGASDYDEPRMLEGAVTFVAPTVDPATRTASVRIETAPLGEPGALRPGMFVRVEITATPAGNAPPAPVVAIPQEAFQTIDDETVIFVPVPGEPNTFAKRAVALGEGAAGLVPVHAGLVEGERFVVAGTFLLKAELGKATAEHQH